MKAPPCWRLGAILVAVWMAATGLVPGQLHAQTVETVVTAPAERERLFAELARDVESLERQLGLLKRVTRLVKPSVVHIEAIKPQTTNSRFASKPLEEAGSGVVIEVNGKFYILTNRHVINQSGLSNITIKFDDGKELHPTNVWADRETDVAVMALQATDLIPAHLGDSTEIEIGEFVIAVGSPFGLSHSITYGIISAMGRRDLELGDGSIRYQDFVQTDAAINPGNSGGPLLNLRGEVIGINTAIASSSGGNEGIGFTIPINMAITVARQFVEHGRPVRAFLGVNLNGDDFTPEYAARLGLPRVQGALVDTVIGNSPAEVAGLRADDVVLRFDGHAIEDDGHLIQVVGFTPVGKEVEVTIFRNGKVIIVPVEVGERKRRSAR